MTGDELKSIRKARGLSVKDLAEQLNVHVNRIYFWQSGAKKIPTKRVKEIEQALTLSSFPVVNSQIVPPDPGREWDEPDEPDDPSPNPSREPKKPDPKITFVEEIDKAIKMAIKSGDSAWCIVILPLPDNNVDIRVCARRKDGR